MWNVETYVSEIPFVDLTNKCFIEQRMNVRKRVPRNKITNTEANYEV